MDKFMLIILAVVIVLIIRQLIPKKVGGFDLLGLPIMAIIRTYAGLPDKLVGLIIGELISLLALGAVVGIGKPRKRRCFIAITNYVRSEGTRIYSVGLRCLPEG